MIINTKSPNTIFNKVPSPPSTPRIYSWYLTYARNEMECVFIKLIKPFLRRGRRDLIISTDTSIWRPWRYSYIQDYNILIIKINCYFCKVASFFSIDTPFLTFPPLVRYCVHSEVTQRRASHYSLWQRENKFEPTTSLFTVKDSSTALRWPQRLVIQYKLCL